MPQGKLEQHGITAQPANCACKTAAVVRKKDPTQSIKDVPNLKLDSSIIQLYRLCQKGGCGKEEFRENKKSTRATIPSSCATLSSKPKPCSFPIFQETKQITLDKTTSKIDSCFRCLHLFRTSNSGFLVLEEFITNKTNHQTGLSDRSVA